MDKFRNMKKSHIALLVIMYMVLMGSFPRFTGWATIFSAIAVGGYFLKNKKDLKELTRKKKSFIFTGIIILAIIGSLNIAVGNNIQNEKLMAEKAKQEQEIKQEEQKKIEEKKLAEEQKRIQEEEAKKKAEEEKRKQEEEAKKKALEEQKKQEELKRKQEEENKIKTENEQAQAAFAQSTGKDNSNESENVDNNQNYTVYKTRTGSKYHSSGCRYLKKSCYETTVSQARNEGLSPCSVCNP
ncbi:transpeptidase-transglycosylase [Clostridium botulinum A2B7 92]|uniref:cell envelope integrity protein TolA n=1 Tax=Clostridium botulinum TaxID=1491 RepID=UPI0007E0584C|nr:cell envelope integrity protein TolA [Clostridium botulinum]KEJ01382.1 transpeptidase-transglycosylase [Clostridium botulinum A2B7 92]